MSADRFKVIIPRTENTIKCTESLRWGGLCGLLVLTCKRYQFRTR